MYVVRITRADIGARVVIRRRIAGPVPLTDVIGTLRSWTAGVLTVASADGQLTEVLEQDLVAAKVIPPAPPRRRSRAVGTGTDDGVGGQNTSQDPTLEVGR